MSDASEMKNAFFACGVTENQIMIKYCSNFKMPKSELQKSARVNFECDFALPSTVFGFPSAFCKDSFKNVTFSGASISPL